MTDYTPRIRTLTLLLFMLACLLALRSPAALAQDPPASLPAEGLCTPGVHQVSLYTGTFFSGDCVTLDLGTYLSSGQMGLPDNTISSVLLGSNTQVVLCTELLLGGVCETLTLSDNDLSNNPIGSDTASSGRVQALGTGNCSAGAYQVAVFINVL